LELMKRAELQRIFGVPSDLGSVHGLPEMQPFFIAWGENDLSPWLSQESTYAEIIRKGSSSPDKVAAAESARKTERADDGNVGNGAEGSALSGQDGDAKDTDAGTVSNQVANPHPQTKRWSHFGFIYEKINTWLFSVNVSYYYRKYGGMLRQKVGYKDDKYKQPWERTWDTDHRIFMRLMWVLAGSVQHFETLQSNYAEVSRELYPDKFPTIAWPLYGQISWTDCSRSFEFNRDFRTCVRTKPKKKKKKEKKTKEKGEEEEEEEEEESKVDSLVFVRALDDKTEKKKVKEDKSLTEEEKTKQIRKIDEETQWSKKLQAKLTSMVRKATDKLHLTPAVDKIWQLLKAAGQWISKQVNWLLEQWYEVIDGCECNPLETLETQGQCETTWVKSALRGIWDAWTLAQDMFTMTKQDGTRIDIPHAMYETAKFMYAHPMLVYAAVTMAEYAMKNMMEFLLDRMAVPIADNNVGLEGYLERTNNKYREEVVKKINERDEIKKMTPEDLANEQVVERKRLNDAWLEKYPHSVQAHDDPGSFLEATFQGPPFALPSEHKSGAGTAKSETKTKDTTTKSDGMGTDAPDPGEIIPNESLWKLAQRKLSELNEYLSDTMHGILETIQKLIQHVKEGVDKLRVIVGQLLVNMWEKVKEYSGKAYDYAANSAPVAYMQNIIGDIANQASAFAKNTLIDGAKNVTGEAAVGAIGLAVDNTQQGAIAVAGLLKEGAGMAVNAANSAAGTGLEIVQLGVAKLGYGQLSLMGLTALATYHPKQVEKMVRAFVDSFFRTMENVGDAGAGALTVTTGGFAGLFALSGLAAWKVWIVGSKVLIAEFVVDSTKYLIELVKQALFLQVYVDNIYGIINMFSLDKFLAMFGKYTPAFPYVAACLRDMNLGGSWARRFGRPAAIARMPGALGDLNRDLVLATLDRSGAFWVEVDADTPRNASRKWVPRHLVVQRLQGLQEEVEADTLGSDLKPGYTAEQLEAFNSYHNTPRFSNGEPLDDNGNPLKKPNGSFADQILTEREAEYGPRGNSTKTDTHTPFVGPMPASASRGGGYITPNIPN